MAGGHPARVRCPRLLLVSLAVAVALAAVSGCSSSGIDAVQPPVDTSAPTVAQPVMTAERLLGRWGADPDTAERLRVPWLRFAHDGTLTGSDGCNAVAGRWTLDRDGTTVRSDVRLVSYAACPLRPRILLDRLTFDGSDLTYQREGADPGTMKESAAPEIVMYLIESSSHSLRPVPVPVEPADASTPRQRAVAGVAALLAADESGDRFASFWGRMCGLATGVESVGPPTHGAPVIVRLMGEGGGLCDLTRPANVLREQQLAWTVAANLGVDPAPRVRVLGPDGKTLFSDLAADRSYVSG